MTQIQEFAAAIGFEHISQLNMDALILYPDVRKMCSADICKHFNRNWSCPPACGSFIEIQNQIKKYNRGILVQTTGELTDSFDLQGIMHAETLQKRRFDTFVRQSRTLYPDLMAMSCGTCTRCNQCTYPTTPCRFPNRLYPSMEACGFLVKEVCEQSGLRYSYGEYTISFVSCILY